MLFAPFGIIRSANFYSVVLLLFVHLFILYLFCSTISLGVKWLVLDLVITWQSCQVSGIHVHSTACCCVSLLFIVVDAEQWKTILFGS